MTQMVDPKNTPIEKRRGRPKRTTTTPDPSLLAQEKIVLDHVIALPNRTGWEVADALKMRLSAAQRHLDTLCERGVLAAEVREGGAFVYGLRSRNSHPASGVVNHRARSGIHPADLAIREFVAANPGASPEHISMKLGVNRKTVEKRLKIHGEQRRE